MQLFQFQIHQITIMQRELFDTPAPKTENFLTQFVKKQAWNLVILGVIGYLFLSKEISFSVSMNTRPMDEAQIAQAAAHPEKGTVSVFSFFDSDKTDRHENTKKASTQKSQRSNLAFIFQSRTSQQHQLDPEIIAQSEAQCRSYIKRFAPVAVGEMKKFRIPASIKIAQGLLESNAGAHPLSIAPHNHFRIPCGTKTDNCTPYKGQSYHNFGNAWESYRGHSLFLQQNLSSDLFQSTSLQSWTRAVQDLYRKSPEYANQLMQIIQYFNLQELDR